MKPFSKRLCAAMRTGRLTKADLRRWFDRPYPTVETWIEADRTPRGPAGEEAERRLSLLEKGIATKRGFPIPVDLSQTERPLYVEKLFHDHNAAAVSRKNTAR